MSELKINILTNEIVRDFFVCLGVNSIGVPASHFSNAKI